MTPVQSSRPEPASTPSDVHDIRALTATGSIPVQPRPVELHQR